MSDTPAVKAAPTASGDRIVALDVLRGFALLGILVMNVQAFAMPFSAYTNPASWGELTGINGAVWSISHVLFDLKFMSIFSMLFGAGVVLFSSRAEAKTGGSARLFYRRMGSLLFFGLLHGYLLFHGDILVQYALCGSVVYLLRNKSLKLLAGLAFVLLLVPNVINVALALAMPTFPPDALAEMQADWAPPADVLAKQIAGMTGSLADQLVTRAPMTLMLETFVFAVFFMWRVTAMMLIGVVLYRTGYITGKADAKYYRAALAVFPVGLALSAWGVYASYEHDFHWKYGMTTGGIRNYWASIPIALGYIALVIRAVDSGFMAGFQKRLAASGRMAFTNYIGQSVVCVLIFYVGGLMGKVERWEQALIVVAILALQLWLSPMWLAQRRYGPLEWLWRVATYGKKP